MDEREEAQRLEKAAQELQAAICTVVFANNDSSQLRLANEWMTGFLSSHLAWPVSLYLAFPPPGSAVGFQSEVRYFSLNLLLSKIRTDWLNIPPSDAREIYDVLLRQLPLHRHDRIVGARLCVVAGAAAALAGVDTCYELVANVVGQSELELPLKIDLLTALAEETLHRGRSLSWMIKGCMQDCCPQILTFLNAVVLPCIQSEILGKVFSCFERWIPAGIVLSELYTEYRSLFAALLEALKVPLDSVFQPAIWALSELVSQVDILPGREAAVSALIQTLLAQKWQYDSAAASKNLEQNGEASVHAQGLCLLLSEIGSIEGAQLCRSGVDGVKILAWLVDASGGGGGLGLEGALMAVEAWPRLAKITVARRGDVLQHSVFAAALQAILKAAKYPSNFEIWDGMSQEEESFIRFRANAAEGALVAIFKELNGAFLSTLLEVLMGTSTWQEAEVCLYVTTAISKELVAAANAQTQWAVSFLRAVFAHLFASPSDSMSLHRQNEKIVETSVLMIKSYAEWSANDRSLVQFSIQYVLNSLSFSSVRVGAAHALKELCCKAAPLLAVILPIDTLIASCEAALSMPVELTKEEEMEVQVAVVQGLASVLAVLPPADAERGLVRLTVGAASTIKEIAALGNGDREVSAMALESALNVIAATVEYGLPDGGQVHPALHLLQDIWPTLETLKVSWAATEVIAAALCNLWGSVASKVGVSFVEVLPGIIAAASSTFKLHKVGDPLLCLSKVVALVSLKRTPELENCLVIMLRDVTSMLQSLDKVMDDREEKSMAGNTGASSLSMQEHADDADFGSSLSMMYGLGSSVLQHFPALLLLSGTFLQIFASATGSVNRKDPDVALVAANFLLDSIQARCNGNVTTDVVTHLDQVVSSYGMLIVQAILRRLALSDVVESLREALTDLLHGLAINYRSITEGAIVSTLNARDFPGKAGFKEDVDKEQFVAALLRQPPHPRARFQDLLRVFSGVCQTLVPAESLQQF